MGSVADYLEKHLTEAFSPSSLEVINESHLHAGHQPQFDGTGETHFRVRIVSDYFSGMNRVERHRAINALIEELMQTGLHAIAIDAKAPSEIA